MGLECKRRVAATEDQGVAGEEHGSQECQIRRLNPLVRLPLEKTCQPGLLRPASTLRTFISSDFFRDLRRKTPLIIVSTFSRSHSLVIKPVGSRQSRHARKSRTPIKEGKPPRNEKDKDESEKSQAHWVYKNRPTRHNWGSSGLRALFFPSPAPSIILTLSNFGISR